jgi:hypothetical protein
LRGNGRFVIIEKPTSGIAPELMGDVKFQLRPEPCRGAFNFGGYV